MSKPEYHLVRIMAGAKQALIEHATWKNKTSPMDFNASKFISDAILKAIHQDRANHKANSTSKTT